MGGPGNRGRAPTPSSTAKQSRPSVAPKTTPNKTSGCVTCGAKPPPCDVFKLTVTCTVAEADSDKTLQLTTSKKLRGNPFHGKSWTRAQEKLKSYDLVMEMHAGYSANGKTGLDEAVDVKAQAAFAGKCGKNGHPRMKAESVGPGGVKIEAPSGATSLTISKLRAHGDIPVTGEKKGFGAIIDAITSLFRLTFRPHEVLITAWGCGVRKPGDGTPNQQLMCLLRVYRRDVWTFGVKVGAIVTAKDSHTTSMQGGYTQKIAARQISGPGGSQSTTTTTGQGAGTQYNKTVTETTIGGNTARRTVAERGAYKVNKIEFSQAGGLKRVQTMRGHVLSTVDKLESSPSTKLVFERNGVDYLEIFKFRFGGMSISLGQLLQNCINAAKAAMQGIKNLFKASPKFGFFCEVDASFFDGSFVFEWGPALEEKAIEERYWPVTFPLVVAAKLMLVNVTVSVGAGVEFKSGAAEFGATVKGSMELKVAIDIKATIGVYREEPLETGLVPTAGVSFDVEAKATVFGYSIARLTAQFKTGLGMPDGKIKIDPQDGISLKGTIKTDPGTILVHASAGPCVYEGTWELFPSKTIYQLA